MMPLVAVVGHLLLAKLMLPPEPEVVAGGWRRVVARWRAELGEIGIYFRLYQRPS